MNKAVRIDFTGAEIRFVPRGELHWTTDSQVPVRLRALRKVAEETKNHDLERDLYVEERKAERGVYLHRLWEELNKPGADEPLVIAKMIGRALWIIVMLLYGALADYGRIFLRPAVWLGSSVWVFHWGYATVLTPLAPQVGAEKAAQFEQATWMLARGNAVPFVGPLTIDAKIKDFLFCAGIRPDGCVPIPPDGFQLLVVAQNVLSIALVFFIGLALRNYFKVK